MLLGEVEQNILIRFYFFLYQQKNKDKILC